MALSLRGQLGIQQRQHAQARVDALGLTAEAGLEAKVRLLLRLHRRDARVQRLEQRDRAEDGLDVVVVLEPLVLAPVQRELVRVLARRRGGRGGLFDDCVFCLQVLELRSARLLEVVLVLVGYLVPQAL